MRDAARGDWVFLRACRGFRYQAVPGAFAQDPEIACTWDRRAHEWLPDLPRMRRATDAAVLARCAAEAREAFAACEREAAARGRLSDADQPTAMAAALAALHEGRAGEGDYLPCPGMVAQIMRGVLEFVVTGNGAAWEEWVRTAWPPAATDGFRERFVAAMRVTIARAECAPLLQQLNELPAPDASMPPPAPSPPREVPKERLP